MRHRAQNAIFSYMVWSPDYHTPTRMRFLYSLLQLTEMADFYQSAIDLFDVCVPSCRLRARGNTKYSPIRLRRKMSLGTRPVLKTTVEKMGLRTSSERALLKLSTPTNHEYDLLSLLVRHQQGARFPLTREPPRVAFLMTS